MKAADFTELMKSTQEAARIHRGEAKPSRQFRYTADQVKAIRAKLGKSQTDFARMIGVPTATLQNWEQGRREPRGAAAALLRVVSESPRSFNSGAKAARKAR